MIHWTLFVKVRLAFNSVIYILIIIIFIDNLISVNKKCICK